MVARNKYFEKGFTLIEAIISLGLIFLIVFSIISLVIGFTRYQNRRLERVMVQENFRNSLRIISDELLAIKDSNILEPEDGEMAFDLFFTLGGVNGSYNIVRYYVENHGSESQIYREEYTHISEIIPVDWKNKIKLNEIKLNGPAEPVSDRIKAISNLLFCYKESIMTIFIVGTLSNGYKVNYLTFIYPRN